MSETKYGNYIVTRLKKGMKLPAFRHGEVIGETARRPGGSRREHVLWLDENTVPGAFYSEYVWHFPGEKTAVPINNAGPEPHVHPFDEVIAFVGTNQEDIFDLGGEVELWLEDRCFIMKKSFLVYIPAGMKHCPLKIGRIDTPIFQYVLGSGTRYEGTETTDQGVPSASGLSKQFVFDYKKNLVHPEYRGNTPDEPGRHMHIAYLDAEVVPGANFYVEASWFGTAPRPKPVPGKEPLGPQPHVHPFPELITFFGTNPDDFSDLGAEVELWIGGEQHIITESFVAYIPGNVVHCPLMVRNVTRPIFHFTAGPGKAYV
jgi:mannose-6-phosphate isomerase-like protein (cupin superfamily)